MYLIIGANGQLGSELHAYYPKSIGLNHGHIEVESPEIIEAIKALKPTVIFNCAAYHNLDKCELNPDVAYKVNAIGAKNLAMAAQEVKAKLVHISTDYVFSGNTNRPYEEPDMPMPMQVYGNTKLAGEYFVQANCDNYIIARISAVFGKYKCRAKEYNFPQMMLNNSKNGILTVVDDQYVTPTYTYNFVRQLDRVLKGDYSGLFHMTNYGIVSWYEFTKKILEKAGVKNVIVNPCESKESVIKRPAYSALSNSNLKLCGIDEMWHIDKALDHYLNGLY